MTRDLPFNPFANITDQSNRRYALQKRLGELERINLGHRDRKASSIERPEVPGSSLGPKMLVMTNKRPFWNEQSQVYQVRIISIGGIHDLCYQSYETIDKKSIGSSPVYASHKVHWTHKSIERINWTRAKSIISTCL